MMWLLFLKPQTIIGDAIATFTGSPICHVQWVFSDGKAWSSGDERVVLPDGETHSNGVRFWNGKYDYAMADTLGDPNCWECYQIPGITDEQETTMRKAAIDLWCQPCGYSFIELLVDDPFNLNFRDPKRKVCSAACEWLGNKVDITFNPKKDELHMWPEDSRQWALKNGVLVPA